MKQTDIFEMDQRKDLEKLEDGSNLLVKDMETVLAESMLPYAEHVILDRALPRVEDGLKPVQRRILYSMYEQGVTPDKGFRKSARIVGDCMGRYHPHGDSSIYDAMVRMAQGFSMSAPLVEGQGNFGNIDGDSAAAMRYTEARLSPIALELLRDIEKDTVKWSRNFDDTTREPDMLPGRFPNLLVNGASGIAVGLATNIPPHNLQEVIDGTVAYIDNKNITLKQMMKIITGPDFPTGGYVVAGDGLEQAYETGKGRILIRAKAHVESTNGDRKNIVFTELPYQVNKSELLIRIAALKEEKKDLLAGISDIVDESDKEGMRAVIKLKKDCNPDQILKVLYKYTPLETSFSINMVAIADGKPQLMGLLDVIAYYVSYQREVILKRSKFELEEARARAHILEGLMIAVQNIDEVVRIIKNSAGTSEARQKLRAAFDLSEKQAQAILDLRLARLTRLETGKLAAELEELKNTIERLLKVINSKSEQMNLIKTELIAIKRAYKSTRRSDVVGDLAEIKVQNETDERPVETVMIAIGADNRVKRISQKNFNMSNKDVATSPLCAIHKDVIETQSDSKVMFFSNKGNCFHTLAFKLPEIRYRDEGEKFDKVFPEAAKDEFPVAVFAMNKDEMPQGELLTYTRGGMIKRTPWSEYALQKSMFQGYKCKEGDEVFAVEQMRQGSRVFYVTDKGGCTKFDSEEIPTQGRVATGVRCITLDDEKVLWAGQVSEKDVGEVFMVTDKGFVKRLPIKDIVKHARNCKGAKGLEFGAQNGKKLLFASYYDGGELAVAVSDRATTLVVEASSASVEGKNTKGKLPQGKRSPIDVQSVIGFRLTPSAVYKEKKSKK